MAEASIGANRYGRAEYDELPFAAGSGGHTGKFALITTHCTSFSDVPDAACAATSRALRTVCIGRYEGLYFFGRDSSATRCKRRYHG
ncbi:hypothetical protein [Candidatus Anaplasma sp. TIGMIC]|uniref:hypothetical protein n=1 Tax=Candidatus Anaplasma sp. TIGMIC TaxID=3020713 RepID=UPI00232AB2F4|nr:hypothetical protein [Candidatus Anaplasma sp. TIGMIC]MDB1135065.1 hypothetical protein [Candidatus Anaplasma sp. TIGMIC]